MKRRIALALVVVVVACCSWSPRLWAQNTLPSAQAQEEEQQQREQAFSGTVLKDGDVFLLKDAVNDITFRLDDPEKVKAYEGKAVNVIGTLEKETNIIRVTKVEPSPE